MRKRFSLLIYPICLVFLASIFSPTALAATKDPYKALNYPFYDNNVSCSDPVTTTEESPEGPTGGSAVYSSGLQPPFILEQFAIHTLKAVAQKKGAPETDVVTEEHVIALLAFMFGEGGDINNPQMFNPLNTGLNAPELVDGAHRGDGVQSFKSFDAGVEATARTMVGSFQSRLAATLIKPGSTAQDFMYALTYYDKFPGNKFWAEASVGNQASYYQTRMQLVRQVRTGYQDIAALIIGTPAREQADGLRDPSKLTYHGTGGGGASDDFIPGDSGGCATTDCADNDNCSDGIAAGSITQTAINLAWADDGHGKNRSDAKNTYRVAMPKYNGSIGTDEYSDCGVFVATVMVASGADPQYPKRGTGVQMDYVKNSGKYQIIPNIKDTSLLQAGDILLYNGSGGEGHTFIFTGPIPGGFDAVGASLHGHVPEAVHAIGSITYDGRAGQYIAARLKAQ